MSTVPFYFCFISVFINLLLFETGLCFCKSGWPGSIVAHCVAQTSTKLLQSFLGLLTL